MTRGQILAELWGKVMAMFAAAIVVLLVSCGQPTTYVQPVQQPVVVQQAQPQYQVIQDPTTGVQQAVFYDNGVQMMMELALFNSMLNSGGYSYVIHHYHDNPRYYRRYDSRTYSRWRPVTNYARPTTTFRNTNPANQSTFRQTTPVSQPRTNFRATSPSRPAYKPSTPSRATSFRKTR